MGIPNQEDGGMAIIHHNLKDGMPDYSNPLKYLKFGCVYLKVLD